MTTEQTLELRVGWVIVYVDAPVETSAFYEKTFGLRSEFAADDGSYAQLDTGPTRLAFAKYSFSNENFAGGVRRTAPDDAPANVEIGLVAEDVDAAYARAVDAGCTPLTPPRDEPRGQRVSFVRDPFGTLLEICSPLH